jgi:hypothetical protein
MGLRNGIVEHVHSPFRHLAQKDRKEDLTETTPCEEREFTGKWGDPNLNMSS